MKTNNTTSIASSSPAASRKSQQTKTQKKSSRLPSRPDHQPQHQSQTEPESVLPPIIDMKKRRLHRGFRTERVLALLLKEAPEFYECAEVVGKWVWVAFSEKQPPEVTAHLAELGFHWNNRRAVWQHPCGLITQGIDYDPRQKYPSYFPADVRPA